MDRADTPNRPAHPDPPIACPHRAVGRHRVGPGRGAAPGPTDPALSQPTRVGREFGRPPVD